MTLKQEFLDMLLLLNPNIGEESWYEENYSIEKDFTMTVCGKSGEDITYSYCCDSCEYASEDCSCEKIIYQKVDLYFWSIDEYGIGYVFGKPSKDYEIFKNIKCINNRKQLLNEMATLKQEFEAGRNAYAGYAKRVLEYKRYTTEFVDEVTEDFSLFENINKDIIPIVFDEDYRKDHDWEKETFTGGDFLNVGVQSVIHIYDSWSRKTDDMKRAIRHEILHYLLWCIAPLGNLCRDDSGIFHYFCKIYDAHAYKELDEYNTQVFNMLQEYSKEEVDEFLKQLLEKSKKEVA